MRPLLPALLIAAALLLGSVAWFLGARAGGEGVDPPALRSPGPEGASHDPRPEPVRGATLALDPEEREALDGLDDLLQPKGGEADSPGGPEPPDDVEEDPLPGSEYVPADGPELEGRYANGALEYRGTQVRDERGEWVREGPWTAWFEDGQAYEEGAYAAGREHGTWSWWWPNGEQQAVGRFVDGAREGPWTFWHENGVRLLEGAYHDGQAVGLWTSWHENGRLWTRGVFAEGVMVGRWVVHGEDGSLDTQRSGLYEDGTKLSD